jgi:hypothetical protein
LGVLSTKSFEMICLFGLSFYFRFHMSFTKAIKQTLSVSLAALILLNTMGYYMVLVGLQYRNDVAMIKALDTDSYDEGQEVTIRIPVAIPYMNDGFEFERVNGKFQHNGETYRMVKQKYAQDTLIVVCVKDTENQRINNALTDYVKSFTDKAGDHQQQSSLKITLSYSKDYIQHRLAIRSTTTGWVADVVQQSPANDLIPTYSPSIILPPERG